MLDAIAVDQLRLRDRSADYRYVSFAHFVGQGRTRRGDGGHPPGVHLHPQLAVAPGHDRRPRRPSTTAGRSSAAAVRPGLGRGAVGHPDRLLPLLHQVRRRRRTRRCTTSCGPRRRWCAATGSWPPPPRRRCTTCWSTLPDTVDQLAARLGIDINDDINHPGLAEPDNLVRVGFRRSGVALHNRMLERHLGNQGQYLWISYDFDSNQGRADLLANPLGPADRDQQNFVHTFEHAGGEVIFTLPNGLQGYMVVDAVGNRLDEAPLNIVRDPRRRDGVVENGISCFGCHGTVGLLRPRETDEVARYTDTHIAEFLGRELDGDRVHLPAGAAARRVHGRRQPLPGHRRHRHRAAAPPKGDAEYTGFVALVGQYESNVGFRGAAAEFNEEYEQLPRARAGQRLPERSPCPARRPRRWSCATTSSASTATWSPRSGRTPSSATRPSTTAAVVNSCSGTRSVPQPAPVVRPPSSGSGGSGGAGGPAAAPAPAAGVARRPPRVGAAAAPPAPAAAAARAATPAAAAAAATAPAATPAPTSAASGSTASGCADDADRPMGWFAGCNHGRRVLGEAGSGHRGVQAGRPGSDGHGRLGERDGVRHGRVGRVGIVNHRRRGVRVR